MIAEAMVVAGCDDHYIDAVGIDQVTHVGPSLCFRESLFGKSEAIFVDIAQTGYVDA